MNPIEGVLISYNNANKFPLSPNYILKLNDITALTFYSNSLWYQKKGCYYFSVKTNSRHSIFYLDNLDLVTFWINEISLSKKFYMWLNSLIDKRYSQQSEEEKQAFANEEEY